MEIKIRCNSKEKCSGVQCVTKKRRVPSLVRAEKCSVQSVVILMYMAVHLIIEHNIRSFCG